MKNTADDNYDVFMFNLRWLYLNFLKFLFIFARRNMTLQGVTFKQESFFYWFLYRISLS